MSIIIPPIARYEQQADNISRKNYAALEKRIELLFEYAEKQQKIIHEKDSQIEELKAKLERKQLCWIGKIHRCMCLNVYFPIGKELGLTKETIKEGFEEEKRICREEGVGEWAKDVIDTNIENIKNIKDTIQKTCLENIPFVPLIVTAENVLK